jgi:hypothetical protein
MFYTPKMPRRVLVGECPKCHDPTRVAYYPYPDPPDFDPTLIVEITCQHCDEKFRLLARLLQVIEEYPVERSPSR